MSKLLDTWAWIEFYDGTDKGEKIYKMIKNGEKLYTSIITVSELSDNYHRGNFNSDHSWKDIENFIKQNSEILDLTTKTAAEAGKIKTEERKQKPDFGLMDAIILATARNNELELITGDSHLTDKEKTKTI